jgi:hypothetical protein
MTLRTKLLLAQMPLGLALVLVCILSVLMFVSLGSHSQTILKDNYRSVLATQRMKESIERLDSAALFLLAGQREKGLQQASEHQPLFRKATLPNLESARSLNGYARFGWIIRKSLPNSLRFQTLKQRNNSISLNSNRPSIR